VDAFGSPTLAADVALFSQLYGLPPAQLTIFNVNVNGAPPAQNAGFATETTLDVEWAHAVAPGAKIALVLGADNSFDNLNAAVQFAIENHLGPAISNSYGAPENLIDDGTFAATEAVLAEGAAAGVSVNYSSGDSGDFSIDEGPGITTVSYPSGSPFATSVGGTSLFVNADNTINFQTGWGNNLAQLNAGNTFPFPDNSADDGLGFIGGAGGGASAIFAKPRFQRGQPGGDFRQQPDISFLADPQTGVEVIQTLVVNGRRGTFVEIIGGTSLACPLFSALWTIGAQAAGGGNIGQAAQTLYDLKDGSITDIRQVTSADNVTGVITTPNGTVNLSASDISQPLFSTRRFVSSLAQGGGGALFNLTFGTDSSLTVDNGWDNVTGLGTPNSPTFIQRLVKQLRH
jgi:subtilase family serine protease